jgi:hypothetical protein
MISIQPEEGLICSRGRPAHAQWLTVANHIESDRSIRACQPVSVILEIDDDRRARTIRVNTGETWQVFIVAATTRIIGIEATATTAAWRLRL